MNRTRNSPLRPARPAGGSLLVMVALAVLAAVPAFAQAPATDRPRHRLVEVDLGGSVTVQTLVEAGFDVIGAPKATARILALPRDDERFARLGLVPRVIDPDPARTAAARTRAELAARPVARPAPVRSAIRPDGAFRTHLLPPFGQGSMGGYWTTAEIKMKLDSLVASDVNDLVADKLDTLGWSVQGRPIWGLRIAKTVAGTDTRPVVFMNALTHAREPEGMQALFRFADDLLSKYGVDPFATHLLEQRRLYVVPLVNPDGYAINENIYFESDGVDFGMWRKNARDNDSDGTIVDGVDGVDLNRNFGYQWGLNSGSSPLPGDPTYRGPSPFSEPETRSQRDVVIALDPVTGFSFHTHGDLILHPWGHTTSVTPDHAAFEEWTDEMTKENAYLGGPSPQVLYQVSGDFNDWTYGETVAKPRAFTWTPEIGNDSDSFWPAPSRIVPLADEMLRSCYVVAAIAGPHVLEDGFEVIEGAMNAGRLTNIQVRARNLAAQGAAGPGLTGTLVALDAGATVLHATVPYPVIAPRTTANPSGGDAFQVTLADTVTPGRLFRFEIRFQAGNVFSRDTIVVPAGTPTVLFADGASGTMANWTVSSAWGIKSDDPERPNRYFADSPAGDYGLSAFTRMTAVPTFNLTNVLHAYALFEAKWELEQNYDWAAVAASTDGTAYALLRSTGSTIKSGFEQGATGHTGNTIFAGSRRRFGREIADLSPFTGAGKTAVRLRFLLRADGSLHYDGIGVDSIRVVAYDPAMQPGPVGVPSSALPASLELAPPFPNPAGALARLEFALPRGGAVTLEVLDVAGRRVRTLAGGTLAAGRYVRGWDLADDAGRRVAPGVYLVRLASPEGTALRRVVVL